jgi:hypothetical protein
MCHHAGGSARREGAHSTGRRAEQKNRRKKRVGRKRHSDTAREGQQKQEGARATMLARALLRQVSSPVLIGNSVLSTAFTALRKESHVRCHHPRLASPPRPAALRARRSAVRSATCVVLCFSDGSGQTVLASVLDSSSRPPTALAGCPRKHLARKQKEQYAATACAAAAARTATRRGQESLLIADLGKLEKSVLMCCWILGESIYSWWNHVLVVSRSRGENESDTGAAHARTGTGGKVWRGIAPGRSVNDPDCSLM